MLIANNQDFMITQNGVITSEFNEVYVVTKEDVDKTFQFISQNSVYSIEEELKNGYITVLVDIELEFLVKFCWKIKK